MKPPRAWSSGSGNEGQTRGKGAAYSKQQATRLAGRVLTRHTPRLSHPLKPATGLPPPFHHAAHSLTVRRTEEQTPHRPNFALMAGAKGGMCQAQRDDFKAACKGRITWAMYFRLWGNGLSL